MKALSGGSTGHGEQQLLGSCRRFDVLSPPSPPSTSSLSSTVATNDAHRSFALW